MGFGLSVNAFRSISSFFESEHIWQGWGSERGREASEAFCERSAQSSLSEWETASAPGERSERSESE